MGKKSNNTARLVVGAFSALFILFQLDCYSQELISDSLIRVKWKIRTAQGWGSPVVRAGVVFINSETDYAVDAISGRKLFFNSAETKQRFKKEFKERYLVLRQLEKFIVVDLHEGTIVNEIPHPVGNYERPLIQSDNLVYIVNGQELVAKNILTGKTHWQIKSNSVINKNYRIVGDKVLACDKENVYCLRSSTGERIWELSLGTVKSNLIINGFNLYVSTSNRSQYKLHQIDISKGTSRILWDELAYEIQIEDDFLYFASTEVIKLRISNSSPEWKSQAMRLVPENITVTEKYVICYLDGSEGTGPMLIFDKTTGSLMQTYSGWQTDDGYRVFRMQQADKNLLVGYDEDVLYGFILK
jgi:outer membrane protein assembly factor BamB